MRRRVFAGWLVLTCLVLLVCQVSRAAYLQSDVSGRPVPPGRIIPPPRPRPPFPPPPPVIRDPGECVRDFVREVTVGQGTTCGGLTVYPLYHHHPRWHGDYMGLERAWKSGELAIEEQGRRAISQLVARNRSGRYVLLVSGDLLIGGIQNRTLREDVLLPPHSGPIVLPVYCIEQYRSSGPANVLEPGEGMASGRVRRSAVTGSSQQEVWNEVEKAQRSLGIDSPTRDHEALYRAEQTRGALAEAARGFEIILYDRPIGAAFCCRGRVCGIDLFANASLFEEHWDRLLGSYWIDFRTGRPEWHRGRKHAFEPGRDAVSRLLREVSSSRFVPQSTPGAGQLLRIVGSPRGNALIHRNKPIHVLLH